MEAAVPKAMGMEGGGVGSHHLPAEDWGMQVGVAAQTSGLCSSSGSQRARERGGWKAWHVARSVAWQVWGAAGEA